MNNYRIIHMYFVTVNLIYLLELFSEYDMPLKGHETQMYAKLTNT